MTREDILKDIPNDKNTLLQRKQDIASALGGGVSIKNMDMSFLSKLIHEIRELRTTSAYQMRRDPRVMCYYVHQVYRNCRVVRENAATLRKRLGLPPVEPAATQDENREEHPGSMFPPEDFADLTQ